MAIVKTMRSFLNCGIWIIYLKGKQTIFSISDRTFYYTWDANAATRWADIFSIQGLEPWPLRPPSPLMKPMKGTLARHIISVFLISPLPVEIKIVYRSFLLSFGPANRRELLRFRWIGVVVRRQCGVPEEALRGVVEDYTLRNLLIWTRIRGGSDRLGLTGDLLPLWRSCFPATA